MHVVRRGVDDRLDLAVGQHLLVGRRPAGSRISSAKACALVLRAREAGDDLELVRTLDRVGQHVRPPSHADAGDAQRFDGHRQFRLCFQLAPIDSTAAWAIFRSVSQSPPLTPTPPMHSPSTRIGTPPSMAVQRSGPAASARPSACVDVEVLPDRALAPRSARLFDAAQTALVVQECSVWKRPPSMRSRMMTWPPASTMQHEIAIPASRAFSMAVAIILRRAFVGQAFGFGDVHGMKCPRSGGIVGHAATAIKGAADAARSIRPR